MSNIKYLLKFGRREHVESFAAGSLYCSNAQTFWGIEDNLKIKGQGDKLEGSSRFFAQKMTVHDYDDGSLVAEVPNCNGLVRYEPAERLPVFCLFAVYEEDCLKDMAGNVHIKLSEKIKSSIREHFALADAVAIIENPEQFLEDVESSIGCDVKHGEVHYFHIDEGMPMKDGGRAMDMEYMKYLVQDVPPVVESGRTTYKFIAKYVYRALLCKDVYFKDEQEYRIVLPNEEIDVGTAYPVKYRNEIRVMNLDSFFNEM